MSADDLMFAIADVQRRRVPCMLLRVMGWYRRLAPDERSEVEELIATCSTDDVISPAVYVQAKSLASRFTR